MRRRTAIVVIVASVIFVVVGMVLFTLSRGNDGISQATVEEQEKQLEIQLKKACDVLNESLVKDSLGLEADRDERADEGVTNSEDIVFSKCVYKNDKETVSLTLRTPRNENGKNINQSVFNEAMSAENVEEVAGFGEKAFWNSEFGQLNVLNDGEWFNLEYGSISPSERTLDQAVEVTEKIAEIN